MHSRTVTSTLNAHSFTVFILKITLHSKRIHKLAKHAESYCSLQGGESLNSCPTQAACSSTTRCHHSTVHNSSLRLQSGRSFRCKGVEPDLWKQSFYREWKRSVIEKIQNHWPKPNMGKTITKHQLFHWIVEWWSFSHISEEKHMDTLASEEALSGLMSTFNKGTESLGSVSGVAI